jgi:hypothetical protein
VPRNRYPAWIWIATGSLVLAAAGVWLGVRSRDALPIAFWSTTDAGTVYATPDRTSAISGWALGVAWDEDDGTRVQAIRSTRRADPWPLRVFTGSEAERGGGYWAVRTKSIAIDGDVWSEYVLELPRRDARLSLPADLVGRWEHCTDAGAVVGIVMFSNGDVSVLVCGVSTKGHWASAGSNLYLQLGPRIGGGCYRLGVDRRSYSFRDEVGRRTE